MGERVTVHDRRAARLRRYGVGSEFELVHLRRLEAKQAAIDLGLPGISQDFATAQVGAGFEAPADVVDLHARRASQELQRLWLRNLHRAIRKARRFRGVRKRHAFVPLKGWHELSEGWYVK